MFTDFTVSSLSILRKDLKVPSLIESILAIAADFLNPNSMTRNKVEQFKGY